MTALRAALLALALLTPAGALAVGPEDNPDVRERRSAVAEYSYSPEGPLTVRVLEAGGGQPFPVDRLSLSAIGDRYERGRTVRAELRRTGPASFAGELGLPEGEWNLDMRVEANGSALQGTHLLPVSKSPVSGLVPLLPPNPEVARVGRLVLWLLGVPVALGLLIGVWAFLSKRREAERELTA